MTIEEKIIWFNANYPEIVEAMQNCSHTENIKNSNPYHIEGDCWSHTMMVCKVTQIKGFDNEVEWASLLHDIGKPHCRFVNKANNYVNFKGHEQKSLELAKPILQNLYNQNLITQKELNIIQNLILHHGDFYHGDISKIKNKEWFNKLQQLHIADKLGAFNIN
jgi:CRISPR/Cas system-associated endonuclease Cas3-HD